MMATEQKLQISLDGIKKRMRINYERRTERTIYDICDLNGRILRTGPLKKNITTLPVNDLSEECSYILLILDGDKICSSKFSVRC